MVRSGSDRLAMRNAGGGSRDSKWASAVLDYLLTCEASGDFVDFSVEDRSGWYSTFYVG